MKQLLQNMKDGKTVVVEVPVPTPKPGTALIRTAASLVSAGTERMLVEFAEKSLMGKAASRPDLVLQVLNKAKREGLVPTVKAAFNRLDQPMPLGYSSAGVIVELGAGMEGFEVGQRVACAGGGYAVHAELAIVPRNLLTPLDDNVGFEEAAFTTLGAIAMHGFRLAEPQLGERVAVIGLGLLGLMAVQIGRAAGCHVFGVDLDPARVKLCRELSIEAVTNPDALETGMTFTKQQGFDAILICADTKSNGPVELAGDLARDKAKVVAVGAVGQEIPRSVYYHKEISFINSRSYGPGRYDPNYEEKGIDYPAGYVRWTEGRNMGSFADLLAHGAVDVKPLISHRFPLEDALGAYELITGKKEEPFLGVLLTYPSDSIIDLSAAKVVTYAEPKKTTENKVRLGVLGAGNFGMNVLLPALKTLPDVELVGVVSASGKAAQQAAKKFGFNYAASDPQAIYSDENINTIAILTRHHLHAGQALAALDAGKNVFVEKPLVLNEEELKLVEERLAQPGTPMLMVGFNRRFAHLALKLKEFLSRRTEPLAAHFRINAGFLPLSHWLHDPEIGGGRMIGEGCHFVDFLNFLVGDIPISVQATAMSDTGKYQQDNVIAAFKYPDGSVAIMSYLANGDKAVAKENVEVFCGGSVAVLDDFRSLTITTNGHRQVDKLRSQDKGHKAEWEVFSKAILAGSNPPIPYKELVGATRVTLQVIEKIRTN